MWVAAAIAVLLIGGLIWAIVADFASEGPETGMTLSEVASDPEGLIGEVVTVSGAPFIAANSATVIDADDAEVAAG